MSPALVFACVITGAVWRAAGEEYDLEFQGTARLDFGLKYLNVPKVGIRSL